MTVKSIGQLQNLDNKIRLKNVKRVKVLLSLSFDKSAGIPFFKSHNLELLFQLLNQEINLTQHNFGAKKWQLK